MATMTHETLAASVGDLSWCRTNRQRVACILDDVIRASREDETTNQAAWTLRKRMSTLVSCRKVSIAALIEQIVTAVETERTEAAQPVAVTEAECLTELVDRDSTADEWVDERLEAEKQAEAGRMAERMRRETQAEIERLSGSRVAAGLEPHPCDGRYYWSEETGAWLLRLMFGEARDRLIASGGW